MGIIRALCIDDKCGDVTVSNWRVGLYFNADSGRQHYTFTCPECNMQTARTCDDRIFDLLLEADVEMWIITNPEELYETRNGPPFCLDDVLELHNELEAMHDQSV